MSNEAMRGEAMRSGEQTAARVRAGLKRRYAAERRFQIYGMTAVAVAVMFLLILFGSIISKGYTAFWQTEIALTVTFGPQEISDGDTSRDALSNGNYRGILYDALYAQFPEVTGRGDHRALRALINPGAAFTLREMVLDTPDLLGKTEKVWLSAKDNVDMVEKGHVDRDAPAAERPVSDQQLAWLDTLKAEGLLRSTFNGAFFTHGGSRNPTQAGILGAAVGSALTLLVTLSLSFPLGVATAVYLEEFAPKNRWTDLIEVNINNLAAVPSIVFGLLGLAMFVIVFGLPRGAPLVGGLVLTLMTLPTIIISARASLRSVPPSIREAALGVGASKIQTTTHHVLPLAMPGMLTGTIIGMAQALGETAPLLMIGMVAFVVGIPSGFTDAATVLPVQIYLWAESAERAFVERTSAAIMVLLALLITMNATAVILRKRFERRW